MKKQLRLKVASQLGECAEVINGLCRHFGNCEDEAEKHDEVSIRLAAAMGTLRALAAVVDLDYRSQQAARRQNQQTDCGGM